eukprot:CAMPEP_0170472828 /NCGR_PEP_ID=MMETSP0123-20130129/14818_1 /TAXON_ID=182087 /ORGANISM="Favella ehrenbergii, Strain Fehren 1" /LENGTH=81 /DNA_ID=CAMNT_0010741407 /DNA_START=21 /DNA_END=262 /DNA_ORIENTATION=-
MRWTTPAGSAKPMIVTVQAPTQSTRWLIRATQLFALMNFLAARLAASMSSNRGESCKLGSTGKLKSCKISPHQTRELLMRT